MFPVSLAPPHWLWLFCSVCFLCGSGAVRPTAAATPNITLVLRDQASGEPMPGRFHVRDAAGKVHRPDQHPFWFDHFVCNGTAQLTLAPGEYSFEAERGPEFSAVTGRFNVPASGTTNLIVTLRRIADLAAEHWWSGETHIHRNIADVELLMRAEDLHVGQVITWWNKVNLWTNQPLPATRPIRFDGDRFYEPVGGEDERDGGALLFFNLPAPLQIRDGTRHFPSSAQYAQRALAQPGAWIDIEKPFWWDAPMWVALGLGHTIGIANNHQNRSGMMDNEAWGHPRDRAKYPGPEGNGWWTQQIYYHLLNCGLRLPPSAGSASGVLPNPVGYNRVYVQVEGELTYEKWCEGLRAGRSFAGNGPLLRCQANRQWPGHVFRSEGPLQIQIDGQLDSRDPIRSVELAQNGRVERITLPARFTVVESGWFLVRAVTALTNTFRFASTAPWYVELGHQPMRPRRASAEFFVDWCRERMQKLEALAEIDPGQKAALMEPWQKALGFWQGKASQAGVRVQGEIIDVIIGQILPARLYIQDQLGHSFFAESAGPNGTAVRYDRQNWINARSVERHTTLSAHPFQVELPPGTYTFLAERGKEYLSRPATLTISNEPAHIRLPLTRWGNLAERGWYSGELHTHREPADLPNLMLAEDLNVTLPLVQWTTTDDIPPNRGAKNVSGDLPAAPIAIDPTHVYYPRNTEYEIFTTAKKQHTLGALFIIHHQTFWDIPTFPLRRLAERARAEGALLDLDKHNWEWSMAIVPILKPDLFELANNHHWRTEFGITNWAVPAPAWMQIDNGSNNERNWALYGFQNYYALLNCGFRLRPSAGTANGVHPVPLGFSRVYVHLDGPFSFEAWMRGLNQGRSFVTTGPMLLVTFNGQDPGYRAERPEPTPFSVEIAGTVLSESPVSFVEIIVDGQVLTTERLAPDKTPVGSYTTSFRLKPTLRGTTWLAARCWEEGSGGRVRFAHTGPVFFDVRGDPPRPRRVEIEWLIERVRREIARSEPLLSAEARAEYQEALRTYEALAQTAR
ncbi:MAG TPA: CehA/McbA family metallohydrolase [Verrucomicrobiae bacterium]|nr:CehA/McbA family metallohydrolase [Verrucomicrobiae bacterium]